MTWSETEPGSPRYETGYICLRMSTSGGLVETRNWISLSPRGGDLLPKLSVTQAISSPSVSVYSIPINFGRPEPILKKLCTYNVYQDIWSYLDGAFLRPSYQSVCLYEYSPLIASQRLDNVPVQRIHAIELLNTSFLRGPCLIEGVSLGLSLYVKRKLGKDVPAAKKTSSSRRFISGTCLIKEKQATHSSQNLLHNDALLYAHFFIISLRLKLYVFR